MWPNEEREGSSKHKAATATCLMGEVEVGDVFYLPPAMEGGAWRRIVITHKDWIENRENAYSWPYLRADIHDGSGHFVIFVGHAGAPFQPKRQPGWETD